MDLYRKSDLPEKTYYQCLVILSEYKNYINVAKQIIVDKINSQNINECIKEFEKFVTGKHDGVKHKFRYESFSDNGKEIYNILMSIKN